MWLWRIPRPNFIFQLFLDQRAKAISVKVNSSPKVSKELDTLFWYLGRRFLKQPCASLRTKQATRTYSPCWCNHVNTSGVESFDLLADLRPKVLYGLFYRPIKSLCNNAFSSNTNNTHSLPTTARAPKTAPPMCSLWWCGRVDMRCVVIRYSWFYCPNVECYAFIWNQLVRTSRK